MVIDVLMAGLVTGMSLAEQSMWDGSLFKGYADISSTNAVLRNSSSRYQLHRVP